MTMVRSNTGQSYGYVVLGPTLFIYLFIFSCTLLLFSFILDKPWSQVSSFLPPRFLPSIFIAYRVQQSHCSSIYYLVLLTHALHRVGGC